MLRWFRRWKENRKQNQIAPEMVQANEVLKLKEEALKTIKRIGDIRAEIDRAADKVIEKKLKKLESNTQAEEQEVLNTSPIFPVYGKRRRP